MISKDWNRQRREAYTEDYGWRTSPELLSSKKAFVNRIGKIGVFSAEFVEKEFPLSREYREARAAFRKRVNGKTKADH